MLAAAFLWGTGTASGVLLCTQLSDSIINVVNYEVQRVDPAVTPAAWMAPWLGLAAIVCALIIGRSQIRRKEERADGLLIPAARAGMPLALSVLAGAVMFAGARAGSSFAWVCLAFLGVGWSLGRFGMGVPPPGFWRRQESAAPYLLAAAIAAATVWHAYMQVHFWRHFLLGYADFGFFTTELEHCLPWKDVGPARFSDTRMGYHCVPMFYTLVPFYALLRSPVFLMVVGPLALNLAAVPFYQLARDRSGSAMVGLLVGLAWLLLPSITRLPYSNSYGFQSIYLAVPWLALCFSLAFRGRWIGSHVCLALALLCEETVCGVALGWGIYLMLFEGRRRAGSVIAGASIAYLLVCTAVIIPHFAATSQYTRLMLFGEMTPATALERITRPRVVWYLMALIVPLAPWLLRQWRVLLVALPTLTLVLHLHQNDYLNIKYWHQSSILPVLFVAAVLGVTHSGGAVEESTPRASIGPPSGLLVTVLLFQQWMGIAPWSQAQRAYLADPRLQSPDPRMAAVEFVRNHFPSGTTSVIATERIAAHFTDYRMVRPAPLTRPTEEQRDGQTVLVLDRSDGWDKIIMEKQWEIYVSDAVSAGFRPAGTEGPVLILARNGGFEPRP